jgi:hypothetical protein
MAKKTVSPVPYTPSWQNRFFDWAEKLPIPNVVVFVLFFLGFILLDHLVPWLEGKLPFGEFDPGQISFQIWLLVGLIAFDYFLSYSKTALGKFRPAMNVNEREYQQISYRFIHLPALTGWLLTLMAALIAIVFTRSSSFPTYLQSGWSLIATYINTIVQGSLFLALALFLFRALRMIRQLYNRVQAVNIFHLESIYAFSGFTVRVAIFFILTSTLGFLTTEIGWFLLFTISTNLLVALAAFIWPLGGVHAKLLEEKERINGENDRRIQEAYQDLHKRMDQKKIAGLGDFRNGLSAMLDLRQEIKKISTWPWDTATLRAFITALFVPLSVWLIQQALLRTLAK